MIGISCSLPYRSITWLNGSRHGRRQVGNCAALTCCAGCACVRLPGSPQRLRASWPRSCAAGSPSHACTQAALLSAEFPTLSQNGPSDGLNRCTTSSTQAGIGAPSLRLHALPAKRHGPCAEYLQVKAHKVPLSLLDRLPDPKKLRCPSVLLLGLHALSNPKYTAGPNSIQILILAHL